MNNLENKVLRNYISEVISEAISDLGKHEKSAFLTDENIPKTIKKTWQNMSDTLDHAWQVITAPFKLLSDLGALGAVGLKNLFSPIKEDYQKIIDRRIEKIRARRLEREKIAKERETGEKEDEIEINEVGHDRVKKNQFLPIIDSEVSDYLTDVLTAYSLAVNKDAGIAEVISLLNLLGKQVTIQDFDVKKLLGLQDKTTSVDELKIEKRLLNTLKYQVLPDYTRASLETLRRMMGEEIERVTSEDNAKELVDQRYQQAIESI